MFLPYPEPPDVEQSTRDNQKWFEIKYGRVSETELRFIVGYLPIPFTYTPPSLGQERSNRFKTKHPTRNIVVDRKKTISYSSVVKKHLEENPEATIMSIYRTTGLAGEAFCLLKSWLDTEVLDVHSHFLSCTETKAKPPLLDLLQELYLIARVLEMEELQRLALEYHKCEEKIARRGRSALHNNCGPLHIHEVVTALPTLKDNPQGVSIQDLEAIFSKRLGDGPQQTTMEKFSGLLRRCSVSQKGENIENFWRSQRKAEAEMRGNKKEAGGVSTEKRQPMTEHAFTSNFKRLEKSLARKPPKLRWARAKNLVEIIRHLEFFDRCDLPSWEFIRETKAMLRFLRLCSVSNYKVASLAAEVLAKISDMAEVAEEASQQKCRSSPPLCPIIERGRVHDRQACSKCAKREGRGAFSTKQFILMRWQYIAFKCLAGNRTVPLIMQQRLIDSKNAKPSTFKDRPVTAADMVAENVRSVIANSQRSTLPINVESDVMRRYGAMSDDIQTGDSAEMRKMRTPSDNMTGTLYKRMADFTELTNGESAKRQKG